MLTTLDQLTEAFAGRGRPMPAGLATLIETHEAESAAIMANEDLSPEARYRKIQERHSATDTVLAALFETASAAAAKGLDQERVQLLHSLKNSRQRKAFQSTDEQHMELMDCLGATQRMMALQLQLAEIAHVDDPDELIALVMDVELGDHAPTQRAVLRAAMRRADALFAEVPADQNKPMHPLAATTATLHAKWSSFTKTHPTPSQQLAAIDGARRAATLGVQGDIDFARQFIQIKSRVALNRAEQALRGRVHADADFSRKAHQKAMG